MAEFLAADGEHYCEFPDDADHGVCVECGIPA